jgi:nucleoside triphosphate diphosphatase
MSDSLNRLLEIMKTLRSPQGCPWDKEQTLASLRPYLIEECYEVLDEMDRVAAGADWAPLAEELGDLLFQIVFHAELARELGHFDFEAVAQAIGDKLTRRHPHVFQNGGQRLANSEAVLVNWAQLKADEKKAKHGKAGSVLDGVPSAAPALQRAERLTEKASRIGFDWKHLHEVRAKVNEELAELDEAIAKGHQAEVEHELGDVLFAVTNLSRHLKVAPEDALRGTIARFTRRFHHVEKCIEAAGLGFGQASLEQMDGFWNEAKALEKQTQSQ